MSLEITGLGEFAQFFLIVLIALALAGFNGGRSHE